MTWDTIGITIKENWMYTLMFGAICGLAKMVFNLHGEKATLEAKVTVLQESNTDLKKDSKDEMNALKKENLQLQKTIQEKYSQEAIFAKYEISQGGVPMHKTSKRPFCPACLHTDGKEVQLEDDPGDDLWRCTVNRNHYYDKPNRRRRNFVNGLDDNPY